MYTRETILLAEGNEDLREMTAYWLGRKGYLVVSANTLADLRATVFNPGIVFRKAIISDDFFAPGKGRFAACLLREFRPEVPILERSFNRSFGDKHVYPDSPLSIQLKCIETL